MNIDFNILNKDTMEDFYQNYYKTIKRKLKKFKSNYSSCSEFLGYFADLDNLLNILDNIIKYSEFFQLKYKFNEMKTFIFSNIKNVKIIVQNYKTFVNEMTEEDKNFIEYLLRNFKKYIQNDNIEILQSNCYTYDDTLLTDFNYKKLMKTIDSEDKRKEIFMIYNTPNHDKINILAESIIKRHNFIKRHSTAEQYKFKNYGDYRLKNLMGHDTQNINNFLGTMKDCLELQYLCETEELNKMKGSELFVWDLDYYINKKNVYPEITNQNEVITKIFKLLEKTWNIQIKRNNKIQNCFDIFRKNKQRGRFFLFNRLQTESWIIQPSCRYPYNTNTLQLSVSIVHYNIRNLKDVQTFFSKMGLVIHNLFGISKYNCFAGPKISEDTSGIMNSLFNKLFIDKCEELTGYSWNTEFGTAIKFMNSICISSFDNYIYSSNDVVDSLKSHNQDEYGNILYTVYNNLYKIVLNLDINSISEDITDKVLYQSCLNYSELWTELYACQIYYKLNGNYNKLIKILLEKGNLGSIKLKNYLDESINPEYFLRYYNIQTQDLIQDSDSNSDDCNQYLSEVY